MGAPNLDLMPIRAGAGGNVAVCVARVRDIGIDEVDDEAYSVYQRFAAEYKPFLSQVNMFAHRVCSASKY